MFSPSTLKAWLLSSLCSLGFFLLGMSLPLLALPLMFLYTIPILLCTYEHGPLVGFFSAVTTSLVLFAFFPGLFFLIFFLPFGVLGVLLGTIVKKTEDAGDLLLIGVAAALACKLLTAFIIYQMSGANLFAPDKIEMENILLSLGESGLSPNGLSKIRENLGDVVDYMILLMPSSLIIFSTAEVLIACSLSSYLRKKAKLTTFFTLPPFGTWRFPRNLILALFVAFICDILSQRNTDLYFLRQLTVNLSVITRTLLIVQGLSMTYCFMELRGFPKILRVSMIVLSFLIAPLGDVFAVLGIVDIGFDLRKKMRRD